MPEKSKNVPDGSEHIHHTGEGMHVGPSPEERKLRELAEKGELKEPGSEDEPRPA